MIRKGELVFAADDKFIDVIRVLKEQGWIRHKHIQFPGCDLKWINYAKVRWDRIRPTQWINHIKNSTELSNKAKLCRYLRQIPGYDDYIPSTWAVEDESELNGFLDEFLQYEAVKTLSQYLDMDTWSEKAELSLAICRGFSTLDQNERLKLMTDTNSALFPRVATNREIQYLVDQRKCQNVWIIKPAALSKGEGIICSSKIDEILATIRRMEFKCVIQKYIERPLLIDGRKFDIRQWIVMTDCDPLTLWWYDSCYLRFSDVEFDLNNLDNRLIHLCNYSVQSESKMWSCADLRSYLPDERIYDEQMVPKMKRIAIEAISSAAFKFQRIGKGFEWFGLDFLLDHQMNPKLLEINISPDVSHSTPVTAQLVPQATEELLQMLTSEGRPSGQWTELKRI